MKLKLHNKKDIEFYLLNKPVDEYVGTPYGDVAVKFIDKQLFNHYIKFKGSNYIFFYGKKYVDYNIYMIYIKYKYIYVRPVSDYTTLYRGN